MRRNKKVMIIALLTTLVIAGSIGGVIVAQAAEGTATGNATQPKTLLSRVAGIMGIDQTKLEAAVKQAEGDMQLEALKTRLQNQVAKGTITQAQADQYLTWYQSKPDVAPFQQQLKDWQNAKPTVPPGVQQWQQAQPKIPGLQGGPGAPNGRGKQGMMNGRGGFGGAGGRGGMMGGARAPALPAGPIQ